MSKTLSTVVRISTAANKFVHLIHKLACSKVLRLFGTNLLLTETSILTVWYINWGLIWSYSKFCIQIPKF